MHHVSLHAELGCGKTISKGGEKEVRKVDLTQFENKYSSLQKNVNYKSCYCVYVYNVHLSLGKFYMGFINKSFTYRNCICLS